MAKKTLNEKLNAPTDLPKVEDMSDRPQYVQRYGGTKMLIAAPLQYNAIMARVPHGKVITADRMRSYLAHEAGADVTCPLTAGIFVNVCAGAADERGDASFPWWRTLRAGGELNEKFPGGVLGHKMRLEMDGYPVMQKGKRYFVDKVDTLMWEITP